MGLQSRHEAEFTALDRLSRYRALNDNESRRLEKALRHVRMTEILRAVSGAFNVPVADIQGKSRFAEHVLPRQVAQYLGRKAGLSLIFIGHATGRDHTTALSSVARIARRRAAEPALDAEIAAIEAGL